MDRSTAVEKHTVRSGAVALLTPPAAALACASISKNTRRAYQSALDRLQAFLREQGQDLAHLTDRQFAEYLGALHEAGTSPPHPSKPFSTSQHSVKRITLPSPSPHPLPIQAQICTT